MTFRDKAYFNFLIWLAVYPSVLLMSYSFGWLGISLPMWIEIAISTAVSVPFIGLVAAPKAEQAVARAKGETPAELKLEQAEEVDGPDPVAVRDETGERPRDRPAA